MNEADKGKTTCTVGGWVTAPVDSLVKPSLTFAQVRDWWQGKNLPPFEDRATTEEVVEFLISEAERLEEDRQWQIKQNVKMFTALEEISKADGTRAGAGSRLSAPMIAEAESNR